MKSSKLSPAQTRTLAKLRFTRVYVSQEQHEAAKERGEILHFTTWHEWSYKPSSNTIELNKTWSGVGIQATIRCLEEKGHLDIVSDDGSTLVVRLTDGPTSTFKLRVRRGEAVHVYEYLAESEAELRANIVERYGNLPFEILEDEPEVKVDETTAPNAATVAKALGSKIAGELGAAEGSSERMQAERIIAAELEGLLGFVERCFGSSITSAGESVFEETIRADAGKLLRELAPVRVPMVGRDYNLVRHVLEGSAPWAIDYLHNRDLWAVRQELPSAVLAHRSSPYYTRLLSIAEERREAQEAATS